MSNIRAQRFALAIMVNIILILTIAAAIFCAWLKMPREVYEAIKAVQSAFTFASGLTFQFFFDKSE